MDKLLSDMVLLVNKYPNQLARFYISHLRKLGYMTITKKELNQKILYKHRLAFRYHISAEGKPLWTLTEKCKSELLPLCEPHLQSNEAQDEGERNIDTGNGNKKTLLRGNAFYSALKWNDGLELYPWQIRALDEWKQNECRGVVEAVTGSGKSRMAIGAIEATLRLGWKVVVLVHTKELQIQWLKVLRKNLLATLDIKYRIGLLGNDHDDSLNNHDILIAIAASASKYYLLADDMEGLVVVDECHHYGSDSWKLCLEENFAARLGLTATYERDDNKMEELDDYFGGIVYQLDFEEASRDNVIAPFKIAFVGVNFEKDEQIAYDIEDSICKKLRRKLIDEFKLEPEPFSEFMKEVNLLADSGYNYGAITAGKYRAALNRRKDIVAMAKQKPYALKLLKAAIKESQGTILFTQTIDSARTAAKKVDSMGISAIAIDSELKAPERKEVLEAYQRKKYKLIAAPKILDEGIDVPDSDLAIVSAASRSKRQMIQRMGRVLRKKNDNRMARVVIIYVKNTSEDPALGAHETFIDMVVDAAEEIRYFDIYGIATPLCDYLNDWRVF